MGANKKLILLLALAAYNLLAATAAAEPSPPAAATTANSTTAATPEARTAYDMLRAKGFPVGILPKGVEHYRLIPNGSFAVELAGSCVFEIAWKYTFYYQKLVGGRIRHGSMSGLSGMMLKAASTRRSVHGISHVGRILKFHLSGSITRNIAAPDFLDSQTCL